MRTRGRPYLNGLAAVLIAVVLLALVPSGASRAQTTGSGWTAKAPVPTLREDASVAAAPNGKIYVVGGWAKAPPGANTVSQPSAVVEEYDPATDTWTTKAPMPTARSRFGLAAASNGRLYAIGGAVSGSTVAAVEEYDPSTDTWVTKTPLPARCSGQIAVATATGTLYVVGGSCSPGSQPMMSEYDPATDTWETRARIPTVRTGMGVAVAANGKLYAVGGTNGSTRVGTIEEYDPATDTWERKTRMPTARTGLGVATASNGKLYAVGGEERSGSLLEEYDPATDTWATRSPMPTPRYDLELVRATNGKLYAIGGRASQRVVGTVEVYDPEHDAEATPPQVGRTGAADRDGRWSTAALSSPRQEMNVATVGSTVIFAGGCTGACYHPRAWSPSRAVDLYDAVTGQWSTAPLSVARVRMAAVAVGDKALFAGGSLGYQGEPSAAVDIYDGARGVWSTASLSAPRYPIAGVAVGFKALFTGGRRFGETVTIRPVVDIYDSTTDQWSTAPLTMVKSSPTIVTAGSRVLFVDGSAVDIYDDATGQWSTGTLSMRRTGYAVGTVGTQVLFAGGTSCVSSTSTGCNEWDSYATVDIYDTTTGQWSTASLSAPRSNIAVTTLGTQAFFAGGYGQDATPSAVVDVYDSASGQWSSATLSEPRWSIGAATIGPQAVFAGGVIPGVRNAVSATVDIYDTTTGQWSMATLPGGGSVPQPVTVDSQILFVHGSDVDLYDSVTGQWSTTSLFEPRSQYAIGVAGTKVLFAGGEGCTRRLPDADGCSEIGPRDTVDIYDSAASA